LVNHDKHLAEMNCLPEFGQLPITGLGTVARLFSNDSVVRLEQRPFCYDCEATDAGTRTASYQMSGKGQWRTSEAKNNGLYRRFR